MLDFLEKTDPKRTLLCLVLLFIPIFFFFLGIPHLVDGDESFYAEMSRQMLIRHDWVATYFNYTPHFDKPPLTFWVNVLSYKVFGINEFSSRIGSAMFGLLGVLLIYFFGKCLFNKRTGILAALMMGIGFGYFVETQLTLIDTALTFFITATLYCFYRGFFEEKSSYLMIMGIPLGLGILTKGPVTLLLSGGTGIIMWIYLTVKKQRKPVSLFNLQLIAGFILAFAICLPWYLAMWFRFKTEFLTSHFGYHMFTRFTETIESHGGSQWYFYLYYVVFLIIGFLPWSANLVGAFMMGVKRRSNPKVLFLLVWSALIFIFFSISQTKLPGYVIPLIPPVALLTGYWWDQILSDTTIRVNFWWGILGQLTGSILLLVFFIIMRSKVPPGFDDLYKAILIIPISLILVSFVTAVLFWRSRQRQTLFQTTFITFYLFWILLFFTLTQIGQQFWPVKDLSADLKSHLQPGDKIVVNILGAFSAPFYTGRPVVIVYDVAETARLMRSPKRVYAMVDQNGIDYLKNKNQSFRLLARRGRGYLISNIDN